MISPRAWLAARRVYIIEILGQIVFPQTEMIYHDPHGAS
jgi:hypothetical protein